jgi:hypothetical protein
MIDSTLPFAANWTTITLGEVLPEREPSEGDAILADVRDWSRYAGQFCVTFIDADGAGKIRDDQAERWEDPRVAHPSTALLWALAKAEGIPPLEVGECKVCPVLRRSGPVRRLVVDDLRNRPGEWRCLLARPRLQNAANAMARQGHLERTASGPAHSSGFYRFRLACCQGHGKHYTTATSLVLRCGPADFGFLIDGRHIFGAPHGQIITDPDNPPTPPWDHLAVLADREQEQGRPWGEWVARWLRDDLGWTDEARAALRAHTALLHAEVSQTTPRVAG